MSKHNVVELTGRGKIRDELTDLIREGACKLIAQGLELEVSEILSKMSERQGVVRWCGMVINRNEAFKRALVIVGVSERGEKHFLAIEDGVRESAHSWREVLLDLKSRGMHAPEVAVGDGALRFWAALEEVFSATRQQRCRQCAQCITEEHSAKSFRYRLHALKPQEQYYVGLQPRHN